MLKCLRIIYDSETIKKQSFTSGLTVSKMIEISLRKKTEWSTSTSKNNERVENEI